MTKILLLMMMMTQLMVTKSNRFWSNQPTSSQAEIQDNSKKKGSFSDLLGIITPSKPTRNNFDENTKDTMENVKFPWPKNLETNSEAKVFYTKLNFGILF